MNQLLALTQSTGESAGAFMDRVKKCLHCGGTYFIKSRLRHGSPTSDLCDDAFSREESALISLNTNGFNSMIEEVFHRYRRAVSQYQNRLMPSSCHVQEHQTRMRANSSTACTPCC